MQDAAEAIREEKTAPPCKHIPSAESKVRHSIPAIVACKHSSFGGVHSLTWSYPVFMGLISGVKLHRSPKSRILGNHDSRAGMLWGV